MLGKEPSVILSLADFPRLRNPTTKCHVASSLLIWIQMGCFVLLVQKFQYLHISPQIIKTWREYNMNYPRIPTHGTPSKKGYFPRNLNCTDVQFAWTSLHTNIPSNVNISAWALTHQHQQRNLLTLLCRELGYRGIPSRFVTKSLPWILTFPLLYL